MQSFNSLFLSVHFHWAKTVAGLVVVHDFTMSPLANTVKSASVTKRQEFGIATVDMYELGADPRFLKGRPKCEQAVVWYIGI